MKYFIAFPITLNCNLRCYYCFHEEKFRTNYAGRRRFTIPQYNKFRDTHLKNAEEIVVHFHGGETFIDMNINTIVAFMKSTKVEKADLLTNGLLPLENYKKILPFKDRIHRIGFTYHRKMIHDVDSYNKLYEQNVKFMHEQGVKTYVKELLFIELREEIKESKRYWKGQGIDFHVQDFKGCDRGRSQEEVKNYTAEDYLLMHGEYKHGGTTCSCMKGYRNILIRGGWNDGDILACFEDPKVIGNIQDNTFKPNYTIFKDRKKGRIDVQGVGEVYKGTFERDTYTPKQCGSN